MGLPSSLRLGFIGAGRMATALARGFVAAGLVQGEQIWASDISTAASQQFAEACGGRIVDDNSQLVATADLLFVAVKPQQVPEVLSQVRGKLAARHLVISIAAGVTLEQMAARSGPAPRLVRVMPNTPCLVGQGASAYCLGQNASAADGRLVSDLFSAVGQAWQVPEKLFDAVTGLSGSGPAFVFLMIEALGDGGVLAGLPRELATALAAQTVRGSAELVLSAGQHPGVLKDQVASPGGTTIAGLQVLEQAAVRAAFMAAVEAASRRSKELGQA